MPARWVARSAGMSYGSPQGSPYFAVANGSDGDRLSLPVARLSSSSFARQMGTATRLYDERRGDPSLRRGGGAPICTTNGGGGPLFHPGGGPLSFPPPPRGAPSP